MNKIALFLLSSILTFFLPAHLVAGQSETNGEYTIVIEGYDWGAGVSKVILALDDSVSSAKASDYKIAVNRHSDFVDLAADRASGERNIIYAYVSDTKGRKLQSGTDITLVLSVAPQLVLSAPMEYVSSEKFRGTAWFDYKMTITDTSSNRIWDTESGRIMPLVDKFDLSGSYVHKKDITIAYASFIPETRREKYPLIIWLHGGGEGGTDLTLPLLANRAANYASDEIQGIFDGAYVLVPQCPGAWMHNESGQYTLGRENDIYNGALMALIKEYIAANPNIDIDRIYVGGCSNGGYMSLKLILLYPDYFAAAFISSLAYKAEYLTDEQIKSITHMPIWFVHSKDDRTTIPEIMAVPVYKRLIVAGAEDVHFTYYDHVVDITGFFGGENFHYFGHSSWIYLHANHCKLDFDGSPVRIDGRPVSIMEWLAAKAK